MVVPNSLFKQFNGPIFWGLLLGAFSAAVLYAPASWVTHWVEKSSNGYLLLQEARGTLWEGSGVVVLAAGPRSQERRQLPYRLNWEMRPVLGSYQLEKPWGWQLKLQQQCCPKSGLLFRMLYTTGGWLLVLKTDFANLHAKSSAIELPVGILSGLGAPWNGLGLEGLMRLNNADLTFRFSNSGLIAQGQSEIDFENVRTQLTTLESIGDFRLNVLGKGPVQFKISSNSENPLSLVGGGEWNATTGLKMRATVSVSDKFESVLGQLLDVFGHRQGNQVHISLG